MKTFLFLPLFVFLVASCAKNTPPVAIPIAPPIAESAQPTLRDTQRDIDTSYEANIRIGEQVDSQRDLITDQNTSIVEALAKIGLIKSITDNTDVDQLSNILKNIKIRNDELQRRNETLTVRVAEQNKALTDARNNAQETMSKLARKEEEADELRRQHEFLSKNLKAKNDEAENLKKKLATAQVYRRWVLGALGALVVGVIVMFSVKSLRPF